MSFRRLWVLVSRLPRESWTVRERLGEHADWTPEMHRLTDLADRLQWIEFAVYAAAGAKPKEPKPIPRPGRGPARPSR